MNYGVLSCCGFKIAETSYLCCDYLPSQMGRARELRWQEAFFEFKNVVQILILLGVFRLELKG